MGGAMNSIVAPSVVGPIVLVLLFLLLVAGLVLVVRLLTAQLRRSMRGRRDEGDSPEEGWVREEQAGAPRQTAGGAVLPSGRPLSGRMLKERYLSGRITRAEYERELRRLQIEESLRDER